MARRDTHSGDSRRIGRSIFAVAAGLVTIAVLDNLIDAILHGTGLYPPVGQPMADGLFLLAFAYRTVDGIFGTYLTGWLAPRRPLAHALTLGGIGVALSSLGLLAVAGGDGMYGPLWYPLALILVAPVCALIGGRLAEAHRVRPAMTMAA